MAAENHTAVVCGLLSTKESADFGTQGALELAQQVMESASTRRRACLSRSTEGRKTRQERCDAPTFSMVVEVLNHNEWCLHTDVEGSVDAILSGKQPRVEMRSRAACSLSTRSVRQRQQ